MRTRKFTSLNTHEYLTQNGKVVRETIDDGTTTKVLDFIYDEAGRPFALRYSTNGGASFITYYYVLNFQGDVVKLVRIYAGTTIQEYEEVANYTYNAWGEILEASGTMAEINPLRYRGYYYDTETGFYYLQSRYYDPANHRFINSDKMLDLAAGINCTNLFAYCANNPILFSDYTGEGIVLACAILGCIFGTCLGMIVGDTIAESKGLTKDDGWSYWQYIVGGGVVGGSIGFVTGWYCGSYIAGASPMLSNWTDYVPPAPTNSPSYNAGFAFEQWFYSFFNIPQHSQQVPFYNSRLDAIMNGIIVELKNYDWAKYCSFKGLVKDFVSQASKYCGYIGITIDDQIIRGVTFFFSSKPPQEIIDALQKIGVGIEWVR